MISNFKMVNSKGKKLSIFARPRDGQTELFILTCSKKDSFSKKTAREVYKNYIDGSELEYIHNEYKVIKKDGYPVTNSEGRLIYDVISTSHKCHPEIVVLPISCTFEKVNRHLRNTYYKLIPKSEVVEKQKEYVSRLHKRRKILEYNFINS